MIESVTVTNYLGESLVLDMFSPEESGLAIKEITGLGASTANVNVTEMASFDGGIFNSARATKRNIVFSLAYIGTNIDESRRKTYKYFPVKKPVRLAFKTTERTGIIDGYVETNDANIFSEASMSTISIVCPDPYMYSEMETITSLSGIDPIFEFPFEKDIENEETMEIGQIRIIKDRSVYYVGDGEVGVTISIHALGDIRDLTIYNTNTLEKMSFKDDVLKEMLGTSIQAKDDIIISTTKGNKYVYLVRDGQIHNIINALNRNADWFQLSKGDNVFTYTASYGEYNAQINIRNRILFEGI